MVEVGERFGIGKRCKILDSNLVNISMEMIWIIFRPVGIFESI